MYSRLLVLFIFWIYFFNLSYCDCFYIFDVGQGNSQLAVFEEEKLGVLYDCGTSSGQEHVKIKALKQDGYSYIFSLKNKPSHFSEKINKAKEFIQNFQIKDANELISKRGSFGQLASDPSSEKKDLSKLQKIIDSHKLQYLFVILSHPDEDHINLIEGSISRELNIMVLCEGNWLEHNTGNVAKTLNFLQKRSNTCIDFPFYSGGLWSLDKEKSCTFKTILDEFKKDGIHNVLSLADAWKSILPVLQFEDLYSVILRKSFDGAKNLGYFKDVLYSDDFSHVYFPLFDVLKNVKIAHINFPFKDVNSQSSIVEIKMPKIKMQFFLTGDASNETFARLMEHDRNFFKKDEGYTSLAMLPHHGSNDNKSIWFFKLFQPDIIGISAGNGMHGHPSKTLIEEIKTQNHISVFGERFELVTSADAMIMYQKKDIDEEEAVKDCKVAKEKKSKTKKREGFIFQNDMKTVPFICTNLLGNIKIDKKGIAAQFSSIIEEENCLYEVDYSGHKEGITCTKDEVGHIKSLSDENCYFCVKTNLCYSAKKID